MSETAPAPLQDRRRASREAIERLVAKRTEMLSLYSELAALRPFERARTASWSSTTSTESPGRIWIRAVWNAICRAWGKSWRSGSNWRTESSRPSPSPLAEHDC